MRIAVGTCNETKVDAVRRAAKIVFPIGDITVNEVATEPDARLPSRGLELMNGRAISRAVNARKAEPMADIGLGIEDGLVWFAGRLMFISAVCALGDQGVKVWGVTQGLPLSQDAVARIGSGEKISTAVSKAYNSNIIGLEGLLRVVGRDGVNPITFYQDAITYAFLDHGAQAPPVRGWD